MRSVVKGSYIKGATRLVKAGAHINYIQYRSGDDRENGPRKFFDDGREGIPGREVKDDLAKDGGKYVHKLILSPGVDGVDIKAYSRAVLLNVGRAKGVDLNWRAIEHNNTDHAHAHVVIFGKDKLGREVQFDRDDFALMREFGDRYLERNHEFERYLDRDMHQLLKEPEYKTEGDKLYKNLVSDLAKDDDAEAEPKERYKAKEWDRDKAIEHLPESQKVRVGEDTYTKYSSIDELKGAAERLQGPDKDLVPAEQYRMVHVWLGKKEKVAEDYFELQAKAKWDKKERKKERKDERRPGETEREFDKLNRDMAKSLHQMERQGSDGLGKGYKQRLREVQGRLGAEHAHFTASEEIKRLQDLAEAEPGKRLEIEGQIEGLRQWDQEQRAEGRWNDLDTLLGARYNREAKELARMLAPRKTPLPEGQPGAPNELAPENPAELDPAKDTPEIKGKDQELDQSREKNAVSDPVKAAEPDLAREGESERKQDLVSEKGGWQDLDSMFGERHGRHDYDLGLTKEMQQEQGQKEMRQFQDLHISQEQKPDLQREDIDRDDGEDLFSQGIVR